MHRDLRLIFKGSEHTLKRTEQSPTIRLWALIFQYGSLSTTGESTSARLATRFWAMSLSPKSSDLDSSYGSLSMFQRWLLLGSLALTT